MADFEPDADSLRGHTVPAWFNDAKLGVMIHWGLYSVPGWAERAGTIQDLWAKRGPGYYFKHNPYAEWYANTIQIAGSGAQQHHTDTFGRGSSYDTFVEEFNEASAGADFTAWSDLFVEARAQYVVLTTKHMDGFGLWPSQVPNPHKSRYHSTRDIVGDVSEAVRARGLKMGLYYSAGYDMTFNTTVIRDAASAIRAIPQDREYADYVDRQLAELIERYRPSVLWNDVSYPVEANLERLLAFYYNTVSDGVVNDRWARIGPVRSLLAKALVGTVSRALPFVWRLLPSSVRQFKMPRGLHYDFTTPEYEVESKIVERKWEAVRGIGPSFGNNRNEQERDLPSGEELVRLLVDVVSKNGNLLLGIGPTPNGDIPELQRQRLLELGAWLAVNGEAVFDTRPWRRAEGATAGGQTLRFTCHDQAVFVIVLGSVSTGPLLLENFGVADGARVHLLGQAESLAWERQGTGLSVFIPPSVPTSPAHALRISPVHLIAPDA